jgi:hypothetical protein
MEERERCYSFVLSPTPQLKVIIIVLFILYCSFLLTDECITRATLNPEPIHLSKVKKCVRDDFCEMRMKSDPSVAYTLSHR